MSVTSEWRSIRDYLQRSFRDTERVSLTNNNTTPNSVSQIPETTNSDLPIFKIEHSFNTNGGYRFSDFQEIFWDTPKGRQLGFAVLWVADKSCAVSIHLFHQRGDGHVQDHNMYDLQPAIRVDPLELEKNFVPDQVTMHCRAGSIVLVTRSKIVGILLGDDKPQVRLYDAQEWFPYQSIACTDKGLMLSCLSQNNMLTLLLTHGEGWSKVSAQQNGLAQRNEACLLVGRDGITRLFAREGLFVYRPYNGKHHEPKVAAYDNVTAAVNLNNDFIVVGNKDGKVALLSTAPPSTAAASETTKVVWLEAMKPSEPVRKIEVIEDGKSIVVTSDRCVALCEFLNSEQEKLVLRSRKANSKNSLFAVLHAHISHVSFPYFLLHSREQINNKPARIEVFTFLKQNSPGEQSNETGGGFLGKFRKLLAGKRNQQTTNSHKFEEEIAEDEAPCAVFCEGYSSLPKCPPMRVLPLDGRLHAFVVHIKNSKYDDVIVLRDKSVYDGLEKVKNNNY